MKRSFQIKAVRVLTVSAALALGLIGTPVAQAGNIVLNGAFDANSPAEQTAPLDWTLTLASNGADFFVGPMPTFGALSAPNSADFGAVGSADDVLSQVLSTTAGQSYTLDFFLAHDSTNDVNDFHVSWNGALVLDLVNAAEFGYTEYTFSGLVATASSTTLQFAGREVPAWYGLDNVSVTSATPEPGSVLLLCTGLVGLVGFGRRRRS